MPAQVRSDFALALNQIAAERNISVEAILTNIAEALLMAYRKERALEGEIINPDDYLAVIDPVSGEARIYKKTATGEKGEDVTPPGFGRIAAQTAGQVLRQKNREEEKRTIIADFTHKIGSVAAGMVLRLDGANVIVDMGKAEAIMPPHEQNPAERYHPNQKLYFYIKDIKEGPRGTEIIVSRADERLVIGLFRKEVPEFQSGAVEVKLIAREAGNRTKLAVASTQSGVDPVGATVGQKGIRVQAVINELGNNEKVDVIQYSTDAKSLIAAALAPAKDIDISLNEEEKTAIAFVPENQLSLAIGKEGGNAKLATKLTGWKIDIKPKQTQPLESTAQVSLDQPNENGTAKE